MSTAFSDAHLLSEVRVLVCAQVARGAERLPRHAHSGVALMNLDPDTLTPWLIVAGREFRSRLMLGTGKYRSREEMRAALEASGAEIITVALRRIDFDDPASRSILEDIDTSRFAILPNTAGCKTAEEAVRIARMADAMGLGKWVKLEVIPDAKYLLPDAIGTLEAARTL